MFSKEKEDTVALKESLSSDFPFDGVYTREEKEIRATSRNYMEIVRSHPERVDIARQIFAEDRIRYYFLQVTDNTPIQDILKKRCSCDNDLWALYKDFQGHGKELPVEIARRYLKEINLMKEFNKDKSVPPPDVMFKYLKRKVS